MCNIRVMAQTVAIKGLTSRQPKACIAGPDIYESEALVEAAKLHMIDNFSIALTHGLLLIAVWRLIHRPDLDHEDPPEPDAEPEGFHARRNQTDA
ncbi:hypothetical protein GCM10009096_31950 [Parasphingorhabdus litoris]|uniref:Uncharacterized protein n=2 Tax=Parasphingorhabdus litoris TaxID=394733 RepID=A0ABN1AYV4_9SPHN